jgi:hypothetical protein
MNMSEFLTKQVEDTYGAMAGLVGLVDDEHLGWQPESGDNWMTTGQVLKHVEAACGLIATCFVSGDWSVLGRIEAEMMEGQERDPQTGMYKAEALPATACKADTLAALESDKAATLAAIAEAGEDRLVNEESAAPWNPTPRSLGYNLFECLQHLASHKSQLFYYLKLQGKPVNTAHLWGM